MKSSTTTTKKGVLGMENIPKIVITLGIGVFALALIMVFLGTFNSALQTMDDTDGVFNVDDVGYNASISVINGIEGLREFDNWWSLLVISGVFLILFAVMFVIARQAKGGGF